MAAKITNTFDSSRQISVPQAIGYKNYSNYYEFMDASGQRVERLPIIEGDEVHFVDEMLPYRLGGSVEGVIRKDGEDLIILKKATLSRSGNDLAFESSIPSIPLVVGDRCTLADAGQQWDLEVISVATGAPFTQVFFRFV